LTGNGVHSLESIKGVHSDLKGILKKLVTCFVKIQPFIYSMVWESHVNYLQSWQLIMI